MSVVTVRQPRAQERRRRSPSMRQVPVEKILLGGQARMDGHGYAAAIGDPLWTSRPILEGPHAALLRAHAVRELDDGDVLESGYGRLGCRCLRLRGRFHDAVDEAGLLRIARDFLTRNSADAGPAFPCPQEAYAQAPIRVAPIRDSDCYQVLDGHHRLAAYAVSGATTVSVRVSRIPVTTELQDVLHRLPGSGRANRLLQPVAAPEVATWPVALGWPERFAAVRRFLDGGAAPGRPTTSLDVGSAYGWFVAGMGRRGIRAEGVDPWPQAATVGAAAYGLDRSRLHTAGVVDFLGTTDQRWDLVSCFGLLGAGPQPTDVGTQRMLRLLDSVTRTVLVVDVAHNPAGGARELLERGTSFARVHDLGGLWADKGRRLFACVRAT